MNLFGLSLPAFIVQFSKIFCIEHEPGTNVLRIRDKESLSCIVNCRLPFILGPSEKELITSLYIFIFKYECEYETKWSKKLYRTVRKCTTFFINNVYIPRSKTRISALPLVYECMLDAAHAKYHQVKGQDSYSLVNNVDKLCRETARIDRYNTFAIDGCHQAVIYVV